jgi:hypothetical protein
MCLDGELKRGLVLPNAKALMRWQRIKKRGGVLTPKASYPRESSKSCRCGLPLFFFNSNV